MRAVGLLNSAKPRFAPIGVDLTRTEPATGAALAGTDGTIEDEAVLGDIDHPTGRVVDDSSHPVLNTERPPAIGKHLAVEGKLAVEAVLVKRGCDLGRRPHLHEIARLEIERLYRHGLAPRASQRQRLE